MIKEFDTEEIVVALRRIIRAVDLQSKYLAHASGLTGPQLLVLQHLAKHGSQTTGEVARAVSVGQATLSDILERLEGKGLVRRERSRQDKRRVINGLTQSGKKAVEKAPPLLQERFVRELVNLQDWEQTLILSILQRVAKMMNAEEIEASPVLVSGPFSVSAQETADFLATGEPPDDSGEP
jgi:DNA-binding MarR family transcriptional regulator